MKPLWKITIFHRYRSKWVIGHSHVPQSHVSQKIHREVSIFIFNLNPSQTWTIGRCQWQALWKKHVFNPKTPHCLAARPAWRPKRLGVWGRPQWIFVDGSGVIKRGKSTIHGGFSGKRSSKIMDCLLPYSIARGYIPLNWMFHGGL